MEYVLRPQTLPLGASELVVESTRFVPDSSYVSTNPATPFQSSVTGGGAWALGATDRLEVVFSVPRVVCFASRDPSGCSSWNRWNGTSFGFAYGVVRSRSTQLMITGGLAITYSDPIVAGGRLGARTKLLFGDRFALELALGASRDLDPPAFFRDVTTRVALTVDLNLQVTRHLLLVADLIPYAPVNRLDAFQLEPFVAVDWAFTPNVGLAALYGTYNVLARRDWDRGVPGTFATLSLRIWMDTSFDAPPPR
jgi:hypothetical protein